MVAVPIILLYHIYVHTLEYTHTLSSTHDIFLKSVMVNDTMWSEMISPIRINVIEGMCSWTKEIFIMQVPRDRINGLDDGEQDHQLDEMLAFQGLALWGSSLF